MISIRYLVNHQIITEPLFTVPTNLSWLHQGHLAGGPRFRRNHEGHERPLETCLEFYSPPSPPRTPAPPPAFRSPGRFIYKDNATASPGGGIGVLDTVPLTIMAAPPKSLHLLFNFNRSLTPSYSTRSSFYLGPLPAPSLRLAVELLPRRRGCLRTC